MTDRWYVARPVAGRLKRYGPVPFEQLRRLAEAGKLQPRRLIRRHIALDAVPTALAEMRDFPGIGITLIGSGLAG